MPPTSRVTFEMTNEIDVRRPDGMWWCGVRLEYWALRRGDWAVGVFRSVFDAQPRERLEPLHVEKLPSREAAVRRAEDVRAEIEAGTFRLWPLPQGRRLMAAYYKR